jgi:hypothetical protein
MSVLQRPWHLATERARLIEMPGALFLFPLTPRGEVLSAQRITKRWYFHRRRGENFKRYDSLTTASNSYAMVRAALGAVACAGAARLGTLTGSVGKDVGPSLFNIQPSLPRGWHRRPLTSEQCYSPTATLLSPDIQSEPAQRGLPPG